MFLFDKNLHFAIEKVDLANFQHVWFILASSCKLEFNSKISHDKKEVLCKFCIRLKTYTKFQYELTFKKKIFQT